MKKTDLINEFKKLGIKEGMELEVHSSLSSFGNVDGGADTVISSLMECVGEEGSIFMPALRTSLPMELTKKDKELGILSKIRIVPENCEHTAMGIIADTFRQRSDVEMGDGIFRICGWGKYAHEAVTGGLDHVIANDGMALLLGVDIYKLTAMHYVEDCMPQTIGDVFAPNEEVNRLYPPQDWMIETGAPPVKAWYTIQKMAYDKGIIKDGYIGNCKYMFFCVKDMIELYRTELKKDALGLYGMNPFPIITLRQKPELKEAAAQWFHTKWGVPKEAYLACMDQYLNQETEYGWYLCMDKDRIVAGMGVIENDFHDRKDLTPNVCAVYTEEEYRDKGIAGRLLNYVVEECRAKGISPIYLVTDHTSFYERYGWEFLCMVQGDGEPEMTRMYIHK